MNLELLLEQEEENWKEGSKDPRHRDIAYYLLNKVLEEEPDNALARSRRAFALKDAENLEGAIEDFTRVLTLPHSNLPTDEIFVHLNERGYCYHQLNKPNEALSDFLKALEIGHSKDSGKATAYMNASAELAALRRKAEAEQHALKSIELEPNSAERHLQIAQFYENTRKFALENKHLLKAIELGVPSSLDISFMYNRLGFNANQLRNYEKAVEYYMEGLTSHTQSAVKKALLLNGIGYALNHLQKYEESRNVLTNAITQATQESLQRGDTAYIHANLGDAYRGLGDSDNARLNYHEALAHIASLDRQVQKVCKRAALRAKKGLQKIGEAE